MHQHTAPHHWLASRGLRWFCSSMGLCRPHSLSHAHSPYLSCVEHQACPGESTAASPTVLPPPDRWRSCICCEAASPLSTLRTRNAVSGRLEGIWSGGTLLGPGSVHHVLIRDTPHLHQDQPTDGDALPDLSSMSDPVVSYCVSEF